MGPDNGLTRAVPIGLTSGPSCLGFNNNSGIRCHRNMFMKCHCCSAGRVRITCPFKCKLSCAAFACDGLRVSGAGPARGSAIAISMSMAGAKGITKGRTIRLCIGSVATSAVHPRGRLGNFRGIRLTPNRAGAIAVGLSGHDFT